MAEKIISPGVFTRENDLSFVQSGVAAIGAAIVGPTVKGPSMIPTLVYSYSEYQALFGDSFKSGSDYYQYLTSITAKEYLKHGGPATIVRVLPGAAVSNATGSSHMQRTAIAGTEASGALAVVAGGSEGVRISYTASDGDTFLFLSEDAPSIPQNNESDGIYYFVNSVTPATFVTNFIAGNPSESNGAGITFAALTGDIAAVGAAGFIDFTGSNTQYGQFTVTSHSAVTEATPAAAGTHTTINATASVTALTVQAGIPKSGSTGDNFTASLKIKTIGDGTVMNSTPIVASTGVLSVGANDLYTSNDVKYGTKDNLRWEVSTVLPKKGTFSLLVRRGDDTSKRKVILETWSGCSLDPQANNYVGSVIGTAFNTMNAAGTIPFIQPSGSWPNRSKYIYVDEGSVLQTVDYLDDNGTLVDATATGSLPMLSSGSFGGGNDGDLKHPQLFYQNISQTNVQGVNALLGQTGNQAYLDAINLLANQDEFDINLIVCPGINDNMHNNITEQLLTMCENRGDVMTIIDPVPFGKEIANAVTEANDKDSSYGAMYWPWVQIADPQTGRYVWVPQSVVMPGIYAFNDKVSAEWFAPAGLNRGGQEIVVQAERKLTHANRDELYEANVNPVATFPGEGVVVWGQKTLQKKSSALDRVNVRRLLINLKKFIASVSKYLVFENNTATTRNRFLSQVNPYMESVQQRQGLYAFKVVMDESNNTPDVIDRNIMKGDIFIQPAKAAEFIVIDFNVMPTGATFND